MKNTPIDIAAVLTRLPLFSTIEEDAIDALVVVTVPRVLRRGEVLFNRGDPSLGFYVVVSGQIKLAFATANGDEKIVDLLGPGQSFGEAVMFMEKPYPVFAAALLDSTVLHIPREPVFSLLAIDPLFARRMLAGLSMRLHSLLQDVEAYSLRSGVERVVGFLLEAAPPGAQGEVAIELPASKHVIASRLNLTPESYSRAQHRLIEQGLIAVSGRRIVLRDITGLRRFVTTI